MDGLQVRLFGELSIQQDGQPIPFPSGKALELFCYLLICRDRAHTRETLSEVLWPGGNPISSKRYLRQALWRLNVTMQCNLDRQCNSDRHRGEVNPFLSINHEWVSINSDAGWWLDVRAFEQAYSAGRDISGRDLSGLQAKNMEAALKLYSGDLLQTWYHDWCSYERHRLQLAYLAMLDQLMGYCEAQQLYAKGLDFGRDVLRYEPARECTHRQLMRLHYRAGDRASAIRQYERCAFLLAQEFGIQPSADTVALCEQIRADRVIDNSIPPAATGQRLAELRETTALTDLHTRLDRIQASLVALQESVVQGGVEHVLTTQNGSPGKRPDCGE